jgi:hypothetical protein
VLLVVDVVQRRRADVARLAEPVVDAIRLRIGRSALPQLEPARELRVDRLGEPLDLVVSQLRREREGGQPGMVEDLVRPGAADAGELALVAEERVQPVVLARQDLGEPLGAEPQRLGAEVLRASGARRPPASSTPPP